MVIEGISGWMKSDFLSFTNSPGEWLPPLGVVQGTADSGLNLRAAADYEADILSRYLPGTTVEIMGVTSEWAHVRLADSAAGYMLLRHLGGDPPAAVANSIPLAQACGMTIGDDVLLLDAGTLVQLTDSRPVPQWRVTESGNTFTLAPDSWVSHLSGGEMGSIPTEAIAQW